MLKKKTLPRNPFPQRALHINLHHVTHNIANRLQIYEFHITKVLQKCYIGNNFVTIVFMCRA